MVNPRDADIPFAYGEDGDIAWVDGKQFYYNHALHLALIAAGEIAGSGVVASDVREAESDIQNQISASPFFEEPVNVTVVEDEDRDVFRAEVTVNNFNETITLPLQQQ